MAVDVANCRLQVPPQADQPTAGTNHDGECFGRIGVLMGGPSTEREISLKSGNAVYESLKGIGLDVIALDIKTAGREENLHLIKSSGISCAFVALHGYFGEDGKIQVILDEAGIPYTGSGAEASRLAMDKVASRAIFQDKGIRVPRSEIVLKDSSFSPGDLCAALGLPLVVKPATQGSSVGLSIVDKEQDMPAALALALSFDEKAIVEEYIRGRELTVGILEEKALPVVEIIPKHRFFDFEAKYQYGLTEYIVPAELDPTVSLELADNALRAHNALGCSGCSRVDIILAKGNTPFVLEINTIPGLTATSLLPKAAKAAGIDFSHLCATLIRLAYEKAKNKSTR
ncbi:MAG: D-alanine--D-alanine ligase [Candidatus Omnitrophota bacterium]